MHILIDTSQQPHVEGVIIDIAEQTRTSRLRITNSAGSVTASDHTMIITNNPLINTPKPLIKKTKNSQPFLNKFYQWRNISASEPLVVLLGLNIRLFISIFNTFVLPSITATQYLSPLSIQLGNLLPMQEVNQQINEPLWIGWERKSPFSCYAVIAP